MSCLLFPLAAGAQCAAIDFTLPSTGCIGQDINVAPASAYLDYEWDFCAGDFDQTPTASQFYGAAGSAFKVELVEHEGQYYGFYTSRNNGKLYRLDFGADVTSTPLPLDLGGLGINSNTLLTIEIVKEGNEFYAFIIDFFNKIYRVRFGSSITNPPMDAEELYSNALLANPIDLVVQEDESGKYLLVANFNSNKITRFQFASSFGEAIGSTSIDEVVVTGSGNLSGISLIRECNLWYAVTTSISGGNITKIAFGAGLTDDNPTLSQISGLPYTPVSPGGIALAFENNRYYAFIVSQQTQSNLYKIDFGNSMANVPQSSSADLGNFGLLTNVFGFSMFKVKSDWLVLGSENTGQNIYRISFPNRCFSNLMHSSANENTITSTTGSGTYHVSLVSHNAMGYVLSESKSITFSSSTPPDISFLSQNVCVDNNVLFTSSNVSGGITNYNWDFGDLQNSTAQNPVNIYADAGTYTVNLVVTASNGCQNFTQRAIIIYNEPVPDFQLPANNPLCTNQAYVFDNTSTVDPGAPVTWQWQINNVNKSSDEDLTFAFTNSLSQDIKLIASIPGCDNERIKNINSLIDGPVIDFSFSGQCEDEIVSFTNNSSGSITGYSWDFDDGTSSTDPSPTHTFSDIDVYDVTLTASNVAGCNNSQTKSVPIYTKPQVNFQAKQPPFSCNGTPTVFEDLTPNPTDSNLSTWQWNFGDAGSGQNTSGLKNPQHVYDNAGMYDVSLTVFTNFLCSATIQLPVTISQTPVVDFSYSAPCEDIAVVFTDGSTGTIDSWEWQIGNTTYTTENATHIFASAGNTNAMLNVTASNGCIGSVSKPIVVPVKLAPDFSVSKNCTNQQTLFTDITNDAADPINTYQWNVIGGASATGSTAVFTFGSPSIPEVKLMVTTQTGCAYSITKPVVIIPSPTASFTAAPEVGGPPLLVQFTNTSVNASSYHWAFNDANNSTSTELSPVFTYNDLGQHEAELTAFNAQNCSHTFSKIISVVMPVIDVAVNGLVLTEFQSGGLRPAVTIFNNGNVPISNLALLINVSGSVIREHVNATIQANSSYRHIFQFELANTNALDYFCIEAEIEDISVLDNEACLTLEESLTTFTPHPNPSASGVLNVNWVLKEDGVVNLKLVNSMGQTVEDFQFNGIEGLNQVALKTTGIGSGVYFVKFSYKQITKVYRVIISE